MKLVAGKTYWHSRRMHNPQFCVSGKGTKSHCLCPFLCCGCGALWSYTSIFFNYLCLSFRVVSLNLEQWYDCPCAREVSLSDMSKPTTSTKSHGSGHFISCFLTSHLPYDSHRRPKETSLAKGSHQHVQQVLSFFYSRSKNVHIYFSS